MQESLYSNNIQVFTGTLAASWYSSTSVVASRGGCDGIVVNPCHIGYIFLFPAVEVVGSNPAPHLVGPAARAELRCNSAVCSFRTLTSTLKTHLTSEHLFTCCDNR